MFIIGPLIPFVSIVVVATIFEMEMNENSDYRCAHCGEIFSLPARDIILAPRMKWKKLAKCPSCGAITRAERVPKKQ